MGLFAVNNFCFASEVLIRLHKSIEMKKILFYLLFLVFGLFIACSSEQATGELSAENFAISWKMTTTIEPHTDESECIFTIENKGRISLTADNWVLYFSQIPRQITETDAASKVVVEQISGDWHRIVPQAGFELKPRQKVELKYKMGGLLLKKSDAPLSPYFVFLDEVGNEKTVSNINNYQILPFEWLDKIDDNKDYPVAYPTPRKRFEDNAELQLLEANELPLLIPNPISLKKGNGRLVLDNTYKIVYEEVLKSEATLLQSYLAELIGLKLELASTSESVEKAILLTNNIAFDSESYSLTVDEGLIEISGPNKTGVFYGIQSLLGLIPLDDLKAKKGATNIQKVAIADAPRFPYRGLQIDLGRNFQTKAQLLKMLDLMAFYKLNKLQLCLSEDEGWRLAIEELPELTEIGAYRGHSLTEMDHLHPSYGSGASTENAYGSGFYSRSDFKEILQYAYTRHIEVIPTINFPAHSRAAIKAMEVRYNKFMEAGDAQKANEFRLIDPEDQSVYTSAQVYNDNVVCVARPSAFHFYETVVDDVIEMYEEAEVPFQFFHTGGDEVPSGAWAGSPLCQALLDSLPNISDPRNLQVYFFDRIVEMLNKKGLRIGGWQEVALEKNAAANFEINPDYANQNVIPYVWSTLGEELDLGYRMANVGYPVVICNVQNLYFDLAYSPSPEEPGLYWGGFVNTKSPWEFAPMDLLKTGAETTENLEPLQLDNYSNILGIQAQLWSETIKGGAMLEYYTLPKLAGFAQRAWSVETWEGETDEVKRQQFFKETWNKFANALGQRELPRWNYLFEGYNYRVPLPGAVIEEGQLKANIAFPGLDIRYATDGDSPTTDSPIYNKALEVKGPVRLKAFDAAGKSSRVVTLR